MSDLKPYLIGGVGGYWYEKEKIFDKAGIKIEYTTSDLLNLKKLQRGRVDIIYLDEIQGWNLIKKTFPEEIDTFAELEKPLLVSKLRIMVSRSYPNARKYLDEFNRGLEKFKKTPEYDQILIKYELKKNK